MSSQTPLSLNCTTVLILKPCKLVYYKFLNISINVSKRPLSSGLPACWVFLLHGNYFQLLILLTFSWAIILNK